MTKEEFKELVASMDKRQGNFKRTKEEYFWNKRQKKIEDVPEIMLQVVERLVEQGITFYVFENVFKKDTSTNMMCDIVLPDEHICFRYYDVDDEISTSKAASFYKYHNPQFHVIMMRSNETIEFIIDEKFKNVLVKAKEIKKPDYYSRNIQKPKRARITGARLIQRGSTGFRR